MDVNGIERMLPACEVCGTSGRGVCRRCWGCGKVQHATCLGLQDFPEGPHYCPACRSTAKKDGFTDITMDRAVMQVVVTGEPFPGTSDDEALRLKRAAGWLVWERGQLWNVHKGRRRIPAVWERKLIVREASR